MSVIPTASVPTGRRASRAPSRRRYLLPKLLVVAVVFLSTLVAATVSAAPADASVRHHVSIRATTVFAPPDYQPSQLSFQARGHLHAAGTWEFPEGIDEGDVSVVDLTFRPAGTSDYFVVQVRSRRTVDVFDDETCTGHAKERGTWTYSYGVGRYAHLRGGGDLSARATYFGEGDPAQECAGISERFTLRLDGSLRRR